MDLNAVILDFAVAAFVCLLSGLVTLLIRANAAKINLIQMPNERSSHFRATPSGGGVGIAVGGSVACSWLAWQIGFPGWILLATTASIAILGFVDDLYNLSSRLRFLLHILLVSVLLIFCRTLPEVELPWGYLPTPLLYGVLMFAGVWWINLFNFMDGIDGLAGSESIFVLTGTCLITLLNGMSGDPFWWWGLAVIGASAGFLTQNWPPAKIFMGDAGSNYLALAIFGFALYTISQGWVSYAAWAILVALFVSDATITLLRRIFKGDRWFAAHREHIYQALSRKWASHKRVTLLFIFVNVVWLFPLAILAQNNPVIAWPIALLAYAPLIFAATLLGAKKLDG